MPLVLPEMYCRLYSEEFNEFRCPDEKEPAEILIICFRGFHRSFNYKRIDISHAYSRTSVRCYFTFKIYNVKFPYIFANALTKTGKQILLLSFHKL